MCQISTGLDVWQVVRRFCTMGLEWWGGNGDAWLLWDPSLDSGPNLQERVVVWMELLKLVKLQQLS
jgi:hypothetical protein